MRPLARLQPSAVRLRHLIRVDGLVGVPDGSQVTPKIFVLGVPFAPQPRQGVNGRAGWQGGSYEDALFPQEDSEGRLVLRFPNAAGADGRLHRRRFRIVTDKADYRPGDEFIEAYRTAGDRAEGDLLGVYTPVEFTLTPDTLELRLVDAHFMLRGQRETSLGIWTGAAPRDVFEHYTRAWRALVADTFDVESRFAWAIATATTADNAYTYARARSNPVRGSVRLEPRGGVAQAYAFVRPVASFLPSGWDSTDAGQVIRFSVRVDVRGMIGAGDTVALRIETTAGQLAYGIGLDAAGGVYGYTPAADGTAANATARIGTLAVDAVNTTHEFAVEIRDRWVYCLLDGQVMGDPLPTARRQGDATGLYATTALYSTAGTADVTSYVVERTYDFLMTGSDKGDRFLPVAPEPGPLVGEWWNDATVAAARAGMVPLGTDATTPPVADLLLQPTRQPSVRRDEDVLLLGADTAGGSLSPGDRFYAGAGSWPAQLGKEQVTGRISGAIYLDFDTYGDFAFRTIADDRARLWVGKTAMRRDAIINDWAGAGHPMTLTASSWVKAGSDAAAAPNPGSPTSPGVLGPTPKTGWYPFVVEYNTGSGAAALIVQIQRATQRGLWRTIGQSDYGSRLRSLAPVDLLAYYPTHYVPAAAADTLGSLEDNSGNGWHGAHSTVAFATGRGAGGPARGDQADDYTGAADSYSYAPATLPHVATAFTLAGWAQPDTVAAGTATIMRRQNNSGHVYVIRRNGASAEMAIVTTTGTGVVTAGALAVGRWSLVVGTWDGVTMRLYVDGALVGSTPWGGAMTSFAGTNPLYFGIAQGATAMFDGRLSDLAVWTRPLTAVEVQALYDARAAATPFAPTAPIGVYREQIRFDSHYEQLKAIGQAFGYQYRLEARSLESGSFPGVLIPRRRVGRDTDYVLDAVEGVDRQAVVSAADTVDRLTVDAQGLADDKGATQTLWQAIDAPAMRRAWVGHHEYESLSDLTLPALVAARAQALLALKSSPSLDVGVVPEGKRELTDTFPLTGALAELAWRAGDALRLSQPDLDVIDDVPRQMTRVVWPIVPDGIGRPSVVFRQRPRGLDLILRRALRTALNADRNYQGQIATATGSIGKVGTGVGNDQYSRVALPGGRRIVAARVVVLTLAQTVVPTVYINGASTGLTVSRVAPIDVTPWVSTAGGDARMYADLRGGTVTYAEYALEVDYVV